jgi:hypothetical protein
MGQHSQQILYATVPLKPAMAFEPLGGDLSSLPAENLPVLETTIMGTSLITHKEIVNFILNQTSHTFMTKNCAAD